MTVTEYNLSVNEYADRLYRFVLKNIRDEGTAQDIIQDTYEKLWLKHENVTYSKVRSYLFTTAYHTLIDYTRKTRNVIMLDEIQNMELHETPERFDLKKNLETVFEKLPDIQRSVILLRDYEGYSYEEIGEITGLSESQVKVYIYRGRLALRKLIGSPEILI
jgi:RNA polymerase sigma-70 factor (ECF subfamily)